MRGLSMSMHHVKVVFVSYAEPEGSMHHADRALSLSLSLS